jgi:hypothetical protein
MPDNMASALIKALKAQQVNKNQDKPKNTRRYFVKQKKTK